MCDMERVGRKRTNKSNLYSRPYRICCAPGCRSNFSVDSKPIQTFPFPDNIALRKKWLAAIKADHKVKLIAPQICVKHFEDHFLLREDEVQNSDSETAVYSNSKIQLIENAVPTIFFDEQPLLYNHKKENFSGNDNVQFTYSKIENTQNFCRICLASNIRLITLATVRKFNCNGIEMENNENGYLFEHLFRIKISDLPTWLKICFVCQNQLENFYKFQKKAISTHKNLTEISKNMKLMEMFCKNSQEKHFSTNETVTETNKNYENLIEDEWNENINLYEEQYISDNKSENISESSKETWNDEETEFLDTEVSEVIFNCPKCLKQFNSQIDFHLHIKNHNKSKRSVTINHNILKCDHCLIEFENEEYLIDHLKMYHSDFENCKSFKCPMCFHKFYNKGALTNHLKSHKNSLSKQWPISQNFTQNNSRNIIEKHEIFVVDEVEETFNNGNVVCELCNILYGTEELLQKHFYDDHLTAFKFKCPFSRCSISFQNESYLKNHILDHQDPSKQNFIREINRKILKSKPPAAKEHFSVEIQGEQMNTYNENDDVNEYYEVEDELNSFSSSGNGENISKHNNKRKIKNKIEYIEEVIVNSIDIEDSIRKHNEAAHEEDVLFEIDINPDFY